MNIKRYTGRTPSEALAKIREELGEDAAVLSTKAIAGGVEMLAMAPEGLEAALEAAEQVPLAPPLPEPEPEPLPTFMAPQPAPLKARARSFAERLLQRGERVDPTMDESEAQTDQSRAEEVEPSPRASAAAAGSARAQGPVEDDIKALGMSTLTFQDYVRERMLRRRQVELDRQNGAVPERHSLSAAPARAEPPVHSGQASGLAARLASRGESRGEHRVEPRMDAGTPAPARRAASPDLRGADVALRDERLDFGAGQGSDSAALAPVKAMAQRMLDAAEAAPSKPRLSDEAPAPVERPVAPAPLRVVGNTRRQAMNPDREDVPPRLRQDAADPAFPRRTVRHQIPLGAQRAPATPRLDDDEAVLTARGRAAAAAAPTNTRDREEMMSELRSMRSLIEERFGMLAFMDKLQKNPAQVQLSQQLFDVGLSPGMVRKLVQAMPENVTDGLAWAQTVLEDNLVTNENEAAIEDHEGVFALIGPTGVGKTTSTAKIAAAFAAKHGAGNLGLITLDAYRVGAHEQLRTYGRILGVPVHTAHDRASLEDLLELLSAKKLVLIDTAGMAQRDHRTRELLDMLSNPVIHKLLVVNAAAQGETVEDVMTGYRAHACDGVVVSKLDEAVKLGPALDALIRHTAKVVGVANGQRVPEDWHRLSAQSLVQRALHGGGTASWRFNAGEVNLMFAATQGKGDARVVAQPAGLPA